MDTISVLISYILVDKLKFFKGDKNVKKVLAWGLIGHLFLYGNRTIKLQNYIY